jgi:hypothetical protein
MRKENKKTENRNTGPVWKPARRDSIPERIFFYKDILTDRQSKYNRRVIS